MAELDLATLPENDFLRLLQAARDGGTNTPPQPPPRAALPSSVTPDTQAALLQATDAMGLRMPVSEEGRRMGIREGVFLDISKGASATTRFRMGLDENQLNQFKLLNRVYGAGNVTLSDDGRFIARDQPTGAGGVEDVMIDPVGVDAGDFAQLGSQIGPMIAGAAGAWGAAKLVTGPVAKVLAGVTGMALAQEGTGAVQDTFTRWLRGNEVNFSEIAKHRAAMAVADEVFGLAAAGGAKLMTKGVEAMLGVAQVRVGTTATKTARDALAAQTGVRMPLTPAQESESKLLARLESMAGGRPASAGAMDRMLAAQQSAEDELRRVFLGLPRTMTDDELAAVLPQADLTGQRALRRLGTEASRLEGNVAAATDDILAAGTAEAQRLAGVDLASPINVTRAGALARQRVVSDFETFRGTMGQRYDDFLSKPEISTRSVSGSPLARDARAIEAKFVPAADRGGVIEPLDRVLPPKVRGLLDDLKGLDGASVSVNDLKQIRTGIDNAIAEGVAIPGTDTAALTSLRKAVDDNITTALQGIDPALLKTWNGLKTDYATGMSRFDRKGIREMLVKEGERGSVGDTQLAESIIGNEAGALDRYNAFKTFFGVTSPEFQSLQAVARQDALLGSLDDMTGYIKGQDLRARLKNLRPEVARELFGTDQAELNRIGEVLARAQGKVATEDLRKLAQSGSLTASKLSALEAAEAERAIAYNNRLIKAAAQGTLNAERIKPSEFVRHVTSMDPADAQRVMGILSDQPDILQAIRQLGVEDLWSRVRSGTPGSERISARALDTALGTETEQRTWRAVLGNDTVDSLRTLVDTLSSREFNVSQFKGGLAGQMDMSRLFLHGEVGTIPELASRYLLGVLYSGPLKRMVTNLATPNDRSRFLNGVIASTPFVEGLMSRYGSDGAFLLMNELRGAVEPMQKRELMIEGKAVGDPSELSPEDFQRMLRNTKPRERVY